MDKHKIAVIIHHDDVRLRSLKHTFKSTNQKISAELRSILNCKSVILSEKYVYLREENNTWCICDEVSVSEYLVLYDHLFFRGILLNEYLKEGDLIKISGILDLVTFKRMKYEGDEILIESDQGVHECFRFDFKDVLKIGDWVRPYSYVNAVEFIRINDDDDIIRYSDYTRCGKHLSDVLELGRKAGN